MAAAPTCWCLDVVIPPPLYSAALNSSAIALRRNKRAIGSLSVGLVITTGLVVGAVLHAVVVSVPLSVAVALGAAVAPRIRWPPWRSAVPPACRRGW